ncbi:serine hydrolase [Bradyrhizobium sp. SSBR45G]|uniref:serine hydrolase domain-containing protein n=1 Tax=unclassified Bradyrhizobium TaxID=2631580 RepID=UPI002342A1D4|nr:MULTISPECIES: serine hydrolase domain-containing protein [unclassified Bradyrhizobium]GLH80176.1 serine hydrolase [Bradyrhizobium sp. SSBR45G]GLH87669.1 serine hydrolase [Bradyrhizobium sp. SSBR45R]
MLTAAVSASAFAQRLTPESDPGTLGFDVDRLERVTQAFQGHVDSGQLPGAVVLIARKHKLAYFRAFGFRDREQKSAMTTDSIFRIASMTKPIVGAGAMMLVEEGKLAIAAPVSNYLPEFKDLQVRVERTDPATGKTETVMQPQLRPMTVQDLLRHTAGLAYPPPVGNGPVADAYRDANVLDRNTTLAEMVTKMSKLPLANQPGQVWEYSAATDVLGRIVEVASGMELDRFIEERITKPLGMSSTGFYVHEADRDRLAQPQIDPATGNRPPMFDATQKPKLFSGGSGLVSTASDYLLFCEMLSHGSKSGTARLLSQATIDLMTCNALKPGIGYSAAQLQLFGDAGPTSAMGQGFGLGFAVRTEAGQNPLPGSTGSFYWTGSSGTTFFIDPKQQLIIIMMIQVPLAAVSFYRHEVRYLAYQALSVPD